MPPLLAAFGLLTVLLHLCGIPLPKFLGPPMALAHVGTAAWLIARGFAERDGDKLA